MFRVIWRTVNVLFIAALLFLGYSVAWEYSVRRYLKGFSDAVVPSGATPEEKIDAMLTWMRSGPPRTVAVDPASLANRNPEVTLNYRQLLGVCGTATNAFLNLSRSAGLTARRLLLLSPQHFANHVVAEVLVDGRWIIVDPTFRLILRDAQGHTLTRQELRDPDVFNQATGHIPNYPSFYNYLLVGHVHIARLPIVGFGLRSALQRIYPTWDESLDWTLLLERESFFFFFASALFFSLFFILRLLLAWYADHRLRVPRFHLLHHIARAGATFFSAPEIEE
jgi:hypothetical protein